MSTSGKDLPKQYALASLFPRTGEVRSVEEENHHRKHIGAVATTPTENEDGKLGASLTSNRPHLRRPEDQSAAKPTRSRCAVKKQGRWLQVTIPKEQQKAQ